MPDPRPSVTDALFGDLPPEARARFGLDAPGEATALPRGTPGRNQAIKAAKDDNPPPRLPGAPASPWQLSKASWMEALKRVVREIGNDRVTSVAGGVTFFGLLALFPAITALVSIYGLFADRADLVGHLSLIERFVPADAVNLIRDQVTVIVSAASGALTFATVFGILIALWSANGGVKALIEALNIAWFERESRGFIKLNLVSLAFTIGAILLIIMLVVVIAVLPPFLSSLPLGPLAEGAARVLRWVVMFGVLMIALAALYRWGPDKEDAKWHWISPGAVFAGVALIVASIGFSWYVSNFGNYNKTYGSLGAVIVLMMWLWIASMVVMVGAEVNSELERQVQKENGIPLEDEHAKVPQA